MSTPTPSRLHQLHAQGLTTPQIADALGSDIGWTRTLLKRQGLRPHRALPVCRGPSSPHDERIPTLHAQGLTTPQIAAALHVSRQWAGTLLQRQGLTPHPVRRPSGQGRRSLPRGAYRAQVRDAIQLRRGRVAGALKREPFIPAAALASILGVSARTIQNDIRVVRGERG